MEYRIVFDCPDRKDIVRKLLDAASKAGAGRYGNYSKCAVVTSGYSTWRSDKGSHPAIGKVGRISKVASVRIEMSCPKGKVDAVCRAIRKAHPYEVPAIYSVGVRYG
ncbi:MAG: hypothetical protein KGH69_02630 [Candidatus Micrarchaeota archaeon]|nr:hypothetical protein [Candidatus Micrarchaeota archaeon]